ncbi:MAG: type II toxin-antitoxin system RelE/ParE family toxin [Candidatus Hydrothermarchaeales archaeon]
MTYKILPTKEFANDIKRIKDTRAKQAIINKIEEAAKNPERFKKLHYTLSGSYRLRVMKYRIIYSINKKKKEMYLEKIVFAHRY